MQANCLMDDEQWIAVQFEDGRIGTDTLYAAISKVHTPGWTFEMIGGLVVDQLWALAKVDATDSVDRGF
jgi:hypothetical protein